MSYCSDHPVGMHDFLEIDTEEFISANPLVPTWVKNTLVTTPFVVLRRGPVEPQTIPIGVRGPQRNQRWASSCCSSIVKNVITPPNLRGRVVSSQRRNTVPGFHALNALEVRWKNLDRPWGPGGSVGFELATGSEVATPDSDLDIILYAAKRMTIGEARLLCAQTADLPCPIDVRIETLAYGFSLAEFAQGGSRILLRTCDGLVLGNDPWSHEFKTTVKKTAIQTRSAP